MKGHGIAGLFIGLLILGGCAAGQEERAVQEEIREQEALSARLGEQKAAEMGRRLELEGKFNEVVRQEAARGKASVVQGENELNVYLSDKLVFSPENALEMTVEGEKLMERIGAILREVPDLPVELEAAAAFKPYGQPEETIAQLNQQLHLQLVKLAEHLEQKIGLHPERIRLQGEAAAKRGTPEELRVRIVLIPAIE